MEKEKNIYYIPLYSITKDFGTYGPGGEEVFEVGSVSTDTITFSLYKNVGDIVKLPVNYIPVDFLIAEVTPLQKVYVTNEGIFCNKIEIKKFLSWEEINIFTKEDEFLNHLSTLHLIDDDDYKTIDKYLSMKDSTSIDNYMRIQWAAIKKMTDKDKITELFINNNDNFYVEKAAKERLVNLELSNKLDKVLDKLKELRG